jgi:hypothetical protein
MDCGANQRELGELAEGAHEYGEYLVMGLPLVLCDFCDADFPSYGLDYLGIDRHVGYEDMKLIAKVSNPSPVQDQVCPRCKRRLAFLNFLIQLRAQHAA